MFLPVFCFPQTCLFFSLSGLQVGILVVLVMPKSLDVAEKYSWTTSGRVIFSIHIRFA